MTEHQESSRHEDEEDGTVALAEVEAALADALWALSCCIRYIDTRPPPSDPAWLSQARAILNGCR